ncbi:hypothetical protein [uncultured Chryseobacterium sp.]|uniref:hypothetical protein n=1 Tax=uncultured Chryseobacterium sp. TaxID=259322 RepID=UPI0025DA5A88|nr:hypothetical protein [uncultured Chryseobacterium sp.]
MKGLLSYEKQSSILDCIIILGTLSFFVLKVMYSSGDLTPDSIQYFLQAKDFWTYKVNFPLGYPLAIKTLSYLTGSYFTASKVVNILSYLGIVLFSYKKKFYFPQTLIIFSFYPFVGLYPYSLSEPLYYFFNYLIIYYVYRISREGIKPKYAAYLGILFFMLVSVRFSGIFVFVFSMLFLALISWRKKYSLISYLSAMTVASLGVFLYLMINSLYCGYAFGNRSHLHQAPVHLFSVFIPHFLYSLCHDFSLFHSILHKGILSRISFIHLYSGLLLITGGILLVIKKEKKLSSFNFYLVLCCSGILLSLLYSYYTTIIDDNIRIKSNAFLYLAMIIVFNIPRYTLNSLKVFVIAILVLNNFTVLIYYKRTDFLLNKYDAFISNCVHKKVNIIYKNFRDKHERNHAAVLFFKARLIDKGFDMFESESPVPSESDCRINTSEIIRMDNK